VLGVGDQKKRFKGGTRGNKNRENYVKPAEVKGKEESQVRVGGTVARKEWLKGKVFVKFTYQRRESI